MSEHDHDFPATSISQVVLAILGGLIAPTLVIVLIAKLLMGIEATHIADPDPAADLAKVEERIKPVAQVEVAPVESGPHVDKSGEEVVKAVCSACHAVGALGSPKIGDKAAWAPRIAQGYDTLIKHAIAGIRSMPARGGNPDLTDGEIANAIAYMANQSGANFKPPVAGDAPAAATPAAAVTAAPADSKKTAKSDSFMDQVAATAPKPAETKAEEKPAAKPAGKTGEQVVAAVCSACHAVGALGSPKIGDKDAWGPRIAQGYDTLVQHALKGIRMMPAKGGNADLTDDEVARAVAHMANQGGANFKAP
ncbi:MAG TPA: c-type cytochrome [Methylophilaceae bacterium]|jgi:cytochrome c5